MKKGINRVASAENSIPGIRRICLIGDPGCDGLGAATMSMFARALAFQPADLKFVLGDLVPFGLEQLYRNVQDVIDAVADTPVYALCGNHDTEYYSDYFGLRNYTLDAGNFLIIVLDNSKRRFSAEALALFDEAIRKNTHDKVMVYFHIPPPNVITGNSLAEENWKPFRDIYLPRKDRIGLFACGHVHAYFEDSIDGIPLVVTGGGGARIEFVHDSLDERSSRHHVVSVAQEGGMLRHAYEPLDNAVYDAELKDGRLVVMLEKALANEFAAHFKYRLMAEEAFAKYGPDNPSLAKLFTALADSEYRHAKNHYFILNKFANLEKCLAESIKGENFEVHTMYREYMEYADSSGHGLAKYTFFDALEAEKVHEKLLASAAAGKADPAARYFTCTSCGYTFAVEKHPQRCPVCGAPHDKITEVA